MLVMMLYFLMPWTAVNLIDFFWLRRGRYSIRDLFTPQGIYGAWGGRGLCAYGIGLFASVPFFVVPNVFVALMVWWESYPHHLEMPMTSAFFKDNLAS